MKDDDDNNVYSDIGDDDDKNDDNDDKDCDHKTRKNLVDFQTLRLVAGG